MGQKVAQLVSADGSVYLYDLELQTLKKVNDIKELAEIPVDIREMLDLFKPWPGLVVKK